MSVTRALGELRKKLAASMKGVQDEIAALRDKIKQTRAQLLEAQNLPLPIDEIIARIPAVVAEHAAWWLDRNGSALVWGNARALGVPKLTGSITLPWSMTEAVSWAMLCASHPKFAGEVLSNLVRRVEYTPGPASSERPAIVERLTAELAELEAAEEAVIDEAVANGVVIQHRPEVVERRTAEAERKKREAEAVAARQAREAALNAAHEAARRRRREEGTPSSYLESQKIDRTKF